MNFSSDFVIVGSGINALVCAALLAKKGHKVRVLERNDRPGGCIRTEELTQPGFLHDVLACWHPLFVTSPGYAGLRADLERHGLRYCNTDTPAAVVLPDGRHFVLHASREKNIAAMNAACAGDGDRYAAAMAEFGQTLALTLQLVGGRLVSWATARTVWNTLRRVGLKGLSEFSGYGLQSARAWLEQTFHSDVVRACLAPWPPHAGISTEAPGSGHMARLIAFTLETAGCPVVRGGGMNLVEAFARCIRAHGGGMETGADVTQVVVEQGTARAVQTADGRKYSASRGVICSVTPSQLYTRLLSSAPVPAAITRQAVQFRHGRADMQIHLALKQPVRWQAPELDRVAMAHLTPGLDGVSRAGNECDRGLLPAEGTIVVGQPAALDPSRVPAGKGMLWIQLQELPSVIKGDAAGEIAVPTSGQWTEYVRERYADRIVARICRHMPGLREQIIGRTALSPADLERVNINLVGGDPYGGACTPDQFLLWRPLRGTRGYTTPFRRLYHIGASTHPGPGLSGGSGYQLAGML
ncbi:MAG: NAD(P)/FAD-dependent oxidoreductase [Gammaproteobacteria bacterium]|nr:NAD(P)/FAD-dependent oxidoreductase [Gammaproteobacteria bacterium]